MFLIVFKALFTEFCNCACAKKIVMLIRIRHTCVALLHKKTVLSLETRLISVIDVTITPMNPHQPIPFHIISFVVFQYRILIYAGSNISSDCISLA